MGKCFACFCLQTYERPFRAMGGTFKDFITTVHGLYDVIDKDREESDENSAKFSCVTHYNHSELKYNSNSSWLGNFMKGVIIGMAAEIFSLKLTITLEQSTDTSNHPNVHNSKILIKEEIHSGRTDVSKKAKDSLVSVQSFCNAFPWHFICDRNMCFLQVGTGLVKLIGSQKHSIGKHVCDVFHLVHPRTEFRFHNFLLHQNCAVFLELIYVKDSVHKATKVRKLYVDINNDFIKVSKNYRQTGRCPGYASRNHAYGLLHVYCLNDFGNCL